MRLGAVLDDSARSAKYSTALLAQPANHWPLIVLTSIVKVG